MKLVECVPNFSEGRDRNVIDAIAAAIKSVNGARLLDVDPGADTNRTVITFVGSPEAVKEAAFQGIKKASELIDMSKHHGAHARMGATDVCPFIPVSDVTMDECAQLARDLGKRVADELKIPVYLYEHAASKPERQNLAIIREGEYEGLAEKLKNPEWKPDFGEPVFNPKSGATVIGAREFLIAYNINLNTTDVKKAKKIANKIREKGTNKLDKKTGKVMRDEKGEKITIPGLFKECKATGWFIEEYKQAQVTMNLTNYKITPPHVVFDKVIELAAEMGLRVTGSELVGLIPKKAMIMAGRHYADKQKACEGVPDEDLIRLAIQSLGLEDISEFDPKKKVIEYAIEEGTGKLVNLTVSGFADELSRSSPAPGGGSVAGLCGALSAGLSSMVANLTCGRKEFADVEAEMNSTAVKAQILKDRFLEAIDRDTEAFNEMMNARKLPKDTPEEEASRSKAIDEATKKATEIPFEVLEMTPRALDLAEEVAAHGNPNALSDAGVAAITALAAAQGAWYNVMINLPSVNDEVFRKDLTEKANTILAEVKERAKKAEETVSGKLASALTPTAVS